MGRPQIEEPGGENPSLLLQERSNKGPSRTQALRGSGQRQNLRWEDCLAVTAFLRSKVLSLSPAHAAGTGTVAGPLRLGVGGSPLPRPSQWHRIVRKQGKK